MNIKRLLSAAGVGAVAIVFALASAPYAFAATPTLSLSSSGGDSVLVGVSGDPNANVMFYYNVASASGMQSMTLGTTNSNGYFSTTISASSYNIIAGNSVYVIVNNQQSAMQTWPAPTGTPTLSQTSVTLGLGQSVTLYSQGSSAAVYMATNANPSVASVQTSGTQVTIVGNQTGGTTATICYAGTASNCASLYITVQAGSVLSFSQNNFTLAVGQGSSVTVTGGSGSYSITSNSNPSSASAVLSGNTITISAPALGNANITVCDTSGHCGTLYVTVGSATSGSLYFSSANPSITVGQIITVTVSGGSGYYVTGNSNSSVASQALNGSTLTISGLMGGATTITVCSAANGCGSLTVNVGGTTTSGQVSFGVTNPTVTLGQSMTISLSGGASYYVSSNANNSIAQATVNGTSLTLYGANAGSDSIIVCVTSGGCSTLYVTVAQSTTTATSAGSLLAAIQSMQSQLAQLVTQIQSMATTLTQLAASVGGTTTGSTAGIGTMASSYTFTEFLNVGSQDAEVTALQQHLAQKGFYTGPITGFYGTLTETAVKQYQAAHGITAAGYVGPSTRAALNAGE